MTDIITVAALNKYVRSILESDVVLTDIAIRGEISNFKRNYKTGHCYFSLGDERAAVKAVMFRSDAQNLNFEPANGMAVVVRGRISLYERDGAFQVYVEYMFEEGVGAARVAFQMLKEKLESEGLFAQERKIPLPVWPDVIGLVTSKTGAALQDILKVAQKRCPLAKFVLVPTTVQGAGAPAEIVRAIRTLDADDAVDLIVVARGGGSAEDLAVFNDEAVVRAAADCGAPVVSAIGHETDFCLLDFAADIRAPTPSAAAEMVLPDMHYVMERAAQHLGNISNRMHLTLNSWYNQIYGAMRHPSLKAAREKVVFLDHQLQANWRHSHKMAQNTLDRSIRALCSAASLADSVSPYGVLGRGYAIATARGRLLRSVQGVRVGEDVQMQLEDGRLGCTVKTITTERMDT